MKIGLVELPKLQLLDPNGTNWTEVVGLPLISKQILMANLEAGGFEVELFNLHNGNYEQELGQVIWRGMPIRKVLVGGQISALDPGACDAWAITNNFTQDRQGTCYAIAHLARDGKPVVVGGSDAIACPQAYLDAGATAIVIDKSGAANWSIFDYVLGKTPRTELSGVHLADGRYYPKSRHTLEPQNWPLPSVKVAQQCLSTDYYYELPEMISPLGAVMLDLGCDRKCDFCQTPTYKTGYRRMTPQRALEWVALQKEAGASAILAWSDQFLGRVLFGDEGRQELLDILQGVREIGLPIAWDNGLELRKATRGRGRNRSPEDLIPDEELVQAVWGWDGRVGCFNAYIPAERPVSGGEAYAKLLPWKQHKDMLKAIARAGVPNICYGVIVGLAEDSHDSLKYLEEALRELEQELNEVNPNLYFTIYAQALIPIQGTPQHANVINSNLLRFDDPAVQGSVWMSCVDTHHLTYEEVADWQLRLLNRTKEYAMGLNLDTDECNINRSFEVAA